MPEARKNGEQCSFCGGLKEEGILLISGLSATICNECVELAGRAYVQSGLLSPESGAAALLSGKRLTTLREALRTIDGSIIVNEALGLPPPCKPVGFSAEEFIDMLTVVISKRIVARTTIDEINQDLSVTRAKLEALEDGENQAREMLTTIVRLRERLNELEAEKAALLDAAK